MSFDSLTHLHLASDATVWRHWMNQEREHGVTGHLVASTHPEVWSHTQHIANESKGICLLGIHPWWAHQMTSETRRQHLDWLAQQTNIHGIGEIGLDYVRAKTPNDRKIQQRVLEEQLALAHTLSRPVLLHCVRAHSDLLHILKGFSGPQIRGVFHGWTGGPQYIAPALDLGLSISFGPAVLHPRRTKIHDSAKCVPQERLCIETDWPDAWQGKDIDPTLGALKTIARRIALLRKQTIESVWAHCGTNAASIWGSRNS